MKNIVDALTFANHDRRAELRGVGVGVVRRRMPPCLTGVVRRRKSRMSWHCAFNAP